jgi:hypothetical protein
MKTTKIILSLVGAALLTLIVLALRKRYLDQQAAAFRETGVLPDGRAASDGDDLRCKRNVFLGIGKKKNEGYCECESWYAVTNPALEQSCKSAVRSRGEKFGNKAAFEATLGTEAVAAVQQAGAQQQQQQQQMQTLQNELLKGAVSSGTTPASSGPSPLVFGGIAALVIVAGAVAYKFWGKQQPATA